jgi:hypothetical protein
MTKMLVRMSNPAARLAERCRNLTSAGRALCRVAMREDYFQPEATSTTTSLSFRSDLRKSSAESVVPSKVRQAMLM